MMTVFSIITKSILTIMLFGMFAKIQNGLAGINIKFKKIM